MASDKTRLLLTLAKLAVSLGAGYLIYAMWEEADPSRVIEALAPWYIPVVAGAIVAVMVFVLLSKLNRGSGN